MSSFTNFKIWFWLGRFTHKFPVLTGVCFLMGFVGSLVVPSLVLSAGSWLSARMFLWAILLGIFFLSGMGFIYCMPGHNWQVGVLIAQKFLKTRPEYKSKLEALIAEMKRKRDSNLKMIRWINIKEELERIEEKRQTLKNLEQKLRI